MSESRHRAPKHPAAALGLEELAHLAGARPLADASELLADIWESDEELDAGSSPSEMPASTAR